MLAEGVGLPLSNLDAGCLHVTWTIMFFYGYPTSFLLSPHKTLWSAEPSFLHWGIPPTKATFRRYSLWKHRYSIFLNEWLLALWSIIKLSHPSPRLWRLTWYIHDGRDVQREINRTQCSCIRFQSSRDCHRRTCRHQWRYKSQLLLHAKHHLFVRKRLLYSNSRWYHYSQKSWPISARQILHC